ncbi:translation initiation factor IF-2 subunit gamma [Candidatus Woesearchaeota archaeon]|nr:translation initiation factor IF-2 subunit gamma [Candidatus Woesearchaeota archaeon]
MSTKKISEQPEINIGLVGHVDSGKTSLTQALSGRWTDTHSEELKRGITIRLGYADASFYQCKKCKTESFTTKEKCPQCESKTTFLRKVSFIDAPGHETLMATMLSGAAIMDYALLLVAANEECPQPQTREHLMALEIIGIKNIIIVQNKIDLVTKEQALNNYQQIKAFVKGTIAEKSPIIPISAQHNINISALIEKIQEHFPTPQRDITKKPLMFIARSFDVNKPGTKIEGLLGGVLGGALKQGKFAVKEKIEIRPGLKIEKHNQITWKPLQTEIVSLQTGSANVKEVTPGGSIGVLTKLDPSFVKSDTLTGNIAGHIGSLPEVFSEFMIKPILLKRVVGTKTDLSVEPIKKSETLMLNVNSAATVGIVTELKKDMIHVKLKLPVCMEKTNRITISRLLGNRWRLIGYSNGVV